MAMEGERRLSARWQHSYVRFLESRAPVYRDAETQALLVRVNARPEISSWYFSRLPGARCHLVTEFRLSQPISFRRDARVSTSRQIVQVSPTPLTKPFTNSLPAA